MSVATRAAGSAEVLEAVPKHWYSWDFVVQGKSGRVAEMDLSLWRERGTVDIEGKLFKLGREGFMSGMFALERNGERVASAVKPSAFSRTFEVRYGDHRYTLRAASLFSRRFVLIQGDTQVGSVTPQGWVTRRADVALPASLPKPVQVFILWLALLLWKRHSDGAT